MGMPGSPQRPGSAKASGKKDKKEEVREVWLEKGIESFEEEEGKGLLLKGAQSACEGVRKCRHGLAGLTLNHFSRIFVFSRGLTLCGRSQFVSSRGDAFARRSCPYAGDARACMDPKQLLLYSGASRRHLPFEQ